MGAYVFGILDQAKRLPAYRGVECGLPQQLRIPLLHLVNIGLVLHLDPQHLRSVVCRAWHLEVVSQLTVERVEAPLLLLVHLFGALNQHRERSVAQRSILERLADGVDAALWDVGVGVALECRPELLGRPPLRDVPVKTKCRNRWLNCGPEKRRDGVPEALSELLLKPLPRVICPVRQRAVLDAPAWRIVVEWAKERGHGRMPRL